MTALRFLAGMAVAYVVMQMVARANVELADDSQTPGARAMALSVLLAAPALAVALLLGTGLATLVAARIAAFAMLGAATIAIVRRDPGERLQAGLFAVLAGATLLLTGLRLVG